MTETAGKGLYNPFVMVTYGMVYSLFMEKRPERCKRYLEAGTCLWEGLYLLVF